MKLYNSLTKRIEEFQPIIPGEVGFYVCGPTVYNSVHIGNLRTYLMADVFRRALESSGMKVNHVMNITDVGHLTSDGDTGEDKMEKNANSIEDVQAIAQKYTDEFLAGIKLVNILLPSNLPKASDHIPQQIEMIQVLIEKGIAYESDEAVYFDTSKFPDYNRLTGQKLEDMLLGARQEVVSDPNKKHPVDFVLWFKTVGRYANHILRWKSPWGEGFPGWHIECSAMSKKYLGESFDVHMGGIDLKFPHHTNEIAQSEAASGKKFVNYWIHSEHLLINEGKMSKSEGNFISIQNVIEKGYNPLAYRYLTLTAHYRSKLNFSWESLTGAQNALNNLYSEVSALSEPTQAIPEVISTFTNAIENDLDTPKAVALMWDMIKSENDPGAKLATLLEFDKVFGLNLQNVWDNFKTLSISVSDLITARDEARANKDFDKSDSLRKEIELQGYFVEDTPNGTKVKKQF